MPTIRELAKITNASPRTVYRWVEEHSAFLSVSKEGKRLVIAEESVPLLRTIAGFYARGMTTASVNAELARQNVPMVVRTEDGQQLTGGEVLEQILGYVQELRIYAADRHEENVALRELLSHQADELATLRQDVTELKEAVIPKPAAVPSEPVATSPQSELGGFFSIPKWMQFRRGKKPPAAQQDQTG